MKPDDRDAYTGHRMTSHEWNGIRELNTRVPGFLLLCLALTFLYAVVSWVLLPAWPSIHSYTPGVLKTDQRLELSEQIQESESHYSDQRALFITSPIGDVSKNPELMRLVQSAGPALYGDNCMVCHGESGEGRAGFPRINDSRWLWGGEPAEILHTLQYGINAGVDNTRQSAMPAFGKDGLLDATQVADVASYVRSFSNPSLGDGSKVERVQSVNRGLAIYEQYCSGCHGKQAEGNKLLGAPALVDDYWLYGGDSESVEQSIYSGRKGIMPAWEERLSAFELKVLAVYVSGFPEHQLADDSGAVQ